MSGTNLQQNLFRGALHMRPIEGPSFRVAGLDLGRTCGFGVVERTAGQPPARITSGQFQLSKHRGMLFSDYEALLQRLVGYEIRRFAYEQVTFMHRQSEAWRELYYGQLALIHKVSTDNRLMKPRAVPVHVVKTLTAGGVRATKQEVIAAIAEAFECVVEGDHEADALGVALAAGDQSWKTSGQS